MAFGRGYGTPFGGGPILPAVNLISEVGDDAPITFDFSDELDGPLPGQWERFVVTANGAVLLGASEATPDAYFSVRGGLGWWRYRRAPVTGNPFTEQGYAASPVGILKRRNAELAVALKSPHLLLRDALEGQSQDAFLLDVTLAMRASDDLSRYVGARLRAQWSAGVWQPAVLEAVSSAGTAPPGVLATAVLPTLSEPEDIWQNNPLHELRLRVVGDQLTASLDGAYKVTATVDPTNGSAKPALFVRCYATRGLVTTTFPVVAALELRTLRDIARLGGVPPIPGAVELEASQLPMLQLPLDELMDAGYFKRRGARVWECVREVSTDVLGVSRLWQAGDTVRALEEFSPGLVPVVVDLTVLRGLREKEGA